MNKNTVKIISLVLSLAMVVSLFPANAFAAGNEQVSQNIVSLEEGTDSASEEPQTSEEPSPSPETSESPEPSSSPEQYISDEELLSLKLLPYEEEKFIDSKDNADGTKTVKLYSEPVKFKNSSGDWENIDNSIVETDPGQNSEHQYKNKASDVEVLISDNLDQSGAVKVQYKGYSVGFKPLDILTEDGKSTGDIGFIRTDGTQTKDASFNSSEKYGSLQFSKTFNNDTDINVIPGSKGVKENIIFHEIPDETGFSYELTVENVTPRLRQDGNLYFVDEEKGILVMMIPLPFMYDSAAEEHESFEIEVLLEKTGEDTYEYTMIPNRSFLEDESTVYPVTLDPSVETLTSGSISDTFVASKSTYANTNFNGDTYLRLGYSPTFSISRGLVKINTMPSELQGMNIVSAIYHAYQDYDGASSPTMEIHKITSNWTPSTVTWNTGRPAYSSTITDETMVNAINWFTWDVTSMAVDGSLTACSLVNYGICIKNDNETLNMYKRFRTQEYTATTPYNINYFEFIYIVNAETGKEIGMKEYHDFTGFGTGSGNGFINPSSGNLLYSITDLTVTSPTNINFSRSYNSQLGYQTPLGEGWSHNYSIWVQKEYDEQQQETAAIVKLGNGNTYRFTKSGSAYIAPSGLFAALVFDAQINKFKLTFLNKTEYLFDANNQIEKITDRNGNWAEFTYDGNILLIDITDSEDNTITITYSAEEGEENLIKTVTGDNKTYTYIYNSSRQLIQAYITCDSQQVGEQYSYTGGVLTTITNPNEYDYDIEYNNDPEKKVIGVTDPLSQEMTLTYSTDGGDILLTTEFNHVTQRYWYGSTSLVLDKTQFENESPTEYIYNGNYQVTHITYPDSTEESYTYNANGTISSYVNATETSAGTTDYTYGDQNNLDLPTQVSEPFDGANKKVTVNEYDGFGNLTSTYVDGFNQETEYTYDADGNVLSETMTVTEGINEYTTETDYVYDSKGRLTTTTLITADPYDDDIVTTQTYDDYSYIASFTDAKDIVLKPSFNALGFVKQEVSAYQTAEETTTYSEYDNMGNVTSETDAKGNETTYTYDALGRQIRADYPDETYETTAYTVRADGTQLTLYTDGAGKQTITVTDKKGQIILEGTIGQAGGYNTVTNDSYESIYDDNTLISFTVTEYDVMGRVLSTMDNTGVETTNEYDDLGRTTETTTTGGGLSATTTYTYDDADNALTETTPEITTATTYDKLGRALTVDKNRNGSHSVTSYEYDGVSSNKLRTVTTDPLNRDRICEYDEKNNLVREISGDRTTVYTYDENGNMLTSTLTDSNYPNESAVTVYTYDSQNRKTSVTYSEDNQYVLYTYDNNGNVLTESLYKNDALDCTTEYIYDDMNRVIEKELNNTTTVVYAYTDNGSLESIKYGSGAADRKIGYVYDETGRTTQVRDLTDGGNALIREYFYVDGQLDHLVDARGEEDAKQEFIYDSLGRLTAVKYYDADDIAVLEEYTIEYNDTVTDAKNQIGAETTTARYGGTVIVTEKGYAYDDLGRLTQESATVTVDGGTPTTTNTSYTYDAVGNRTSMTQGVNTLYYDYNNFDQLTRTATDSYFQNIVTEYDYDLSGNQKSKTEGIIVDRYYYDDANWLESVTRQVGQDPVVTLATFEYDANGQRTRKVANSEETNYYYSGLHLLYTKDNNGDIIEENILELDGSIINGRRADTNDYWYRQDICGSITNIVDVLDYVVKSYIYDAYGNTSSTGSFINNFAYTRAVIDTETGLYYMNARYYDPETGRFISEDSYRGSSEEFWHLYIYCNGDPVNYSDPTGHIRYDRTKAIQYAKKWYNSANQVYRDFRWKGTDCANFASQILYAGGIPMSDSWHSYYLGKAFLVLTKYDATNSWTTVIGCYKYFKSSKYKRTTCTITKTNVAFAVQHCHIRKGDLMFFDDNGDGTPNHTTVVSSVQDDEIYYTGHSNPAYNKTIYTEFTKHPKAKIYAVLIKNSF